MAAEQPRELYLRNALGAPKTEMWDGVEHLVIPVVALQEGVIQAVNAPTAELVPEDVLIRSYSKWNGLPIVLDHPKTNGHPVAARSRDVRDKHAFGIIRDAQMRGKRLGMEVLVNPQRLREMGEEKLLSDLRAGEPIEVSVGVHAHTAAESGNYNGRAYKAKWLEIMPDHLAFLPRGHGACSVAAGCGANRHASYFVTAEAFVPMPDRLTMVFTTLEGESLDEQMRAVYQAINDKYQREVNAVPAMMPSAQVMQIFDDHCIVQTDDGDTLSVPYKMQDGKAVLGEATKVKQAWVAAETADCTVCDGLGQQGGKDCPACDGTGKMRTATMKVLVGARNSRTDAALIQSMHDHAVMLGATCQEVKAAERPALRTATIRHEGGKWVLYTKDGSKRLGTHDTKAEAEAQESAIEAAKMRRAAQLAAVN